VEPTGDPERDRVTQAAESRYPEISDPEVFGCWHVVVEAAHRGWLTADGRLSVGRLAGTLAAGGSLGVEEYDMDVEDGRVVVTFLDERYTCPRPAMVDELRRLDEYLHSSATAASSPPPQPGLSPDPAELRRVLDALSGAAAARAGSDPAEVARLRREATEALGRLRGTDTSAAPDLLRQQAAEALRAFADWAENPAASGARVDAVIQRLEETVGRRLPGRRVEEQQTRDRIAGSARDAIARRLAEASGARPAGDQDDEVQ